MAEYTKNDIRKQIKACETLGLTGTTAMLTDLLASFDAIKDAGKMAALFESLGYSESAGDGAPAKPDIKRIFADLKAIGLVRKAVAEKE
jgi:hypothetical protein